MTAVDRTERSAIASALPLAPASLTAGWTRALDTGLAIARAHDGWTFVALPAPIVAAAGMIAAWPHAAAVAWTTAQLTIVGIGAARELRGHGATRWTDVIAATSTIADGRAVIGGEIVAVGELPALARPRLVGGAAFAPGTAELAPWTGFGDAWFMLPRWTYVHDCARAYLVLAIERADADAADANARWQAELAVHRIAVATRFVARAQPAVTALAHGDAAAWHAHIDAIVAAIATGRYEKVVAANRTDVTLAGDVRVADVLAALDERHPESVRVMVRPPDAGALIAATPERLVTKTGAAIACDALAGSIARGDDLDGAAAELLASGKDRREHDLVVHAIVGALGEVVVPAAPSTRALRHVVHMHTPIRATLRAPRHLLEVAARLHPTPAVGGTPTADAVEWIAAHEPVARGWYASPVGWFDLAGDGELAVAIRSGVLAGTHAHLWAGAGIVAGSDPARELAETEIKLRTMLGALGIAP